MSKKAQKPHKVPTYTQLEQKLTGTHPQENLRSCDLMTWGNFLLKSLIRTHSMMVGWGWEEVSRLRLIPEIQDAPSSQKLKCCQVTAFSLGCRLWNCSQDLIVEKYLIFFLHVGQNDSSSSHNQGRELVWGEALEVLAGGWLCQTQMGHRRHFYLPGIVAHTCNYST